jgi:hypothetical protein
MADDGRPDSLVRDDEPNVRVVAAGVSQDWPDRGADLLALDVRGVTGNEERGNADERRNDRLGSADSRSFLWPRQRCYFCFAKWASIRSMAGGAVLEAAAALNYRRL